MKVINPNDLPTAPITDFRQTQGDLKFLSKKNYDKLKNNIERRGFYLPIYVWKDEEDQKWLLDGHQRKHVLETEGWYDPIPYLVVPADNLDDAAERLLEITSQFGTITQEGIDEFIAKFELPEVDVLNHTNFDGIFEFSIEPEQEEVEELEVEPEIKDVSMRINIRLLDGSYQAKYVENKKTTNMGEFEDMDSLKKAVLESLTEWEFITQKENK